MEFKNKDKLIRAKKRVDNIKGFYKHLLVYFIVNSMLSTLKVFHNMKGGETFQEAFYDFSTFVLWMAWGIGIIFHWVGLLDDSSISLSLWKSKKLNQYLDEEKNRLKINEPLLNLVENNSDLVEKEIDFRARKRLNNVLSFYAHLVVFIVVNTFIYTVLYFATNISFYEWTTYATVVLWGIIVGIHALMLYLKKMAFIENWELQKLKEFMREERGKKVTQH